MNREDVIAVFRLMLARDPISEEAIQARIRHQKSVQLLIHSLLDSKEFNGPACTERLDAIPLTQASVENAYYLILGRQTVQPAGMKHHLRNLNSQRQLILALTQSNEYQLEIKQQNDLTGLVTSAAFNSRPRTIYLHIPKTAGKAFEKLAESNYGRACSLSTTGNFARREWQQAQLLGGHFFYRKYDEMTGRRLFLSLVRDPVDRAISRFNFYKNQTDGIPSRAQRGFDHDDMKATIRESGFRTEFVDNFQCGYLAQQHDFKSVQRAFAQDTFIVGHFDRIDDWIALLAERLGWDDVKLPAVNVAIDSEYTKAYREDKKLISLLEKRNKEDYKLLRFIEAQGVYESSGPGFDYTPFRVRPVQS